MRTPIKITLITASVLCGVALCAGVTYAASYKAPPEETSYQFGEMTASDHNFQSLAYYFDSGTGTNVDPFIVKNGQHLRNLAKLQNSGAFPNGLYVSLGSSFQFEGDAMEPIGTTAYPWTGVFNGESYIVTGLKVSTSAYTNVGMFGIIGTNTATGTVHSLVLAGPSITYTGTSACNIGIVAGSKNTTPGHVSVVENIEIFGGTSAFTAFRAHLRSGGTPTSDNAIVGVGGSTSSGFVSSLSSTPTYSSTYSFGSLSLANTDYDLWLNGETVVNSK